MPGQFQFRLGAKVGLTFFKDVHGADTFLSVLVDPALVKRFTARLHGFVELGVGLLVLSGVPDDSVLLEAKGGRVTGALSTFELRPSLGLAYTIREPLSIYMAPAFVWNPTPNERFEHPSLTRVEMVFGIIGQL